MTARRTLHAVTRAAHARDQAAERYRAAIVAARDAGNTLQAIADAAGTGKPAVLRLIRRARQTKGPDA